MNNVSLSGRLCADPEVRTTSNNLSCCQFALAVDRAYKDSEGNRQADFIDCVAWRNSAQILGRYGAKGLRVELTGVLQKRSYKNKNNVDVYVTEVIVDKLNIIDFKKDSTKHAQAEKPSEEKPTAAEQAPTMPDAPSMDDFDGLPFEI